MKLQCDNCENGPCTMDLNWNIAPESIVACFLKKDDTAIWKELSPKPEWPKEPELMSFHKARSKANDGDILKLSITSPSNVITTTEITVGEKCSFYLTWEQFDSNQWQIIPADPESEKVLTAEEALEKYKYASPEPESLSDWESGFYEGFMNGKPEGRLERDLELRPIIDWIYKWVGAKELPSPSDDQEFMDILNNTKPLKAE